MKNKLFILSIVIVASIMLGAQPYQGNKNNRNDIINKLNLSEDQKSKIEDIRFEHQKIAIELRAELQKNRLSQKQLLKSDNVDKSEYLALVEQGNAVRSKLQISRADMQMNILEQLDETQRKIWNDSGSCCGIGNGEGRGMKHKRSGKNFRNGRMDCPKN
jgi:Spy/CpxP family protein refolding chaperone